MQGQFCNSKLVMPSLQHNEATGKEEEAIKSNLLVSLVPIKCVICMQKLRGIKDKDHRRLKWKLSKLKGWT